MGDWPLQSLIESASAWSAEDCCQGVVAVESEYDDQARSNDVDLRRRKGLSTRDEIPHRYADSHATGFDEREQVSCIGCANWQTQIVLKQSFEIAVRREIRSAAIANEVVVHRPGQKVGGASVLQQQEHVSFEVRRRLRLG